MTVAQPLKSAGSKYASEFNERLKSDAPLTDAVAWWDSVLGSDIDMETIQQLSPAESAAFGLCLHANWEASYGAPPVTDEFSTEYYMQKCWMRLKRARTALKQQQQH
jgi:hypothetical protein